MSAVPQNGFSTISQRIAARPITPIQARRIGRFDDRMPSSSDCEAGGGRSASQAFFLDPSVGSVPTAMRKKEE